MTFPQPTRRERYPKPPSYSLQSDSIAHPKTDVVFNVEFRIDSHGSPDTWAEPGDPIEITIWSVKLSGFEPELMYVMRADDLETLENKLCDSIAQGDWDNDDPDW